MGAKNKSPSKKKNISKELLDGTRTPTQPEDEEWQTLLEHIRKQPKVKSSLATEGTGEVKATKRVRKPSVKGKANKDVIRLLNSRENSKDGQEEDKYEEVEMDIEQVLDPEPIGTRSSPALGVDLFPEGVSGLAKEVPGTSPCAGNSNSNNSNSTSHTSQEPTKPVLYKVTIRPQNGNSSASSPGPSSSLNNSSQPSQVKVPPLVPIIPIKPKPKRITGPRKPKPIFKADYVKTEKIEVVKPNPPKVVVVKASPVVASTNLVQCPANGKGRPAKLMPHPNPSKIVQKADFIDAFSSFLQNNNGKKGLKQGVSG